MATAAQYAPVRWVRASELRECELVRELDLYTFYFTPSAPLELRKKKNSVGRCDRKNIVSGVLLLKNIFYESNGGQRGVVIQRIWIWILSSTIQVPYLCACVTRRTLWLTRFLFFAAVKEINDNAQTYEEKTKKKTKYPPCWKFMENSLCTIWWGY